MATTSSNSHSHPVKVGGKSYATGSIGHQHTVPDQFTAEEVKALKAILGTLNGGSGGGTTPVPNPPPPDPPDPPPPLTGEVINPGTGTIAAAIALGKTDLVLRGGTYRDSFGSTQRTDTVSLRNYPGEFPVIDGTGLAQNFLYLGSGGNWTLTGIKIQAFRPFDSGVIGVGAGSLTLVAAWMQGLGTVDNNIHLVYAFGNGSVTIRGSRLLDAPGAAVVTYKDPEAITPTVTVTDSELTAKTYAGLFYDGGTITLTRTRLYSPTYDMSRRSSVAVTLIDCQGGGAGTPPAVRVNVV